MSSTVIVSDLATVGKVESNIQFVIATIIALVLAGIAVYQLFKQQYKKGLIILAIAVIVYALSYYNNYLVSVSPTYAAASGANNLASIIFK
jgi:uncharacterized membrane protein YccC